jgi:hypothetical protein
MEKDINNPELTHEIVIPMLGYKFIDWDGNVKESKVVFEPYSKNLTNNKKIPK